MPPMLKVPSVLKDKLGSLGDKFGRTRSNRVHPESPSASTSIGIEKTSTVSLPIRMPDPFNLNSTDDVFQCVDTDFSKSLDLHEARFGVNAFGLYPTEQMMKSAFAGAQTINSKAFAELIPKFLKAKGTNAPARGRKAVPYSRRGLYLAELRALMKAYVDSGWLQERCDESNKSGKHKFQLAVNLYSFDEFVVRPSTTPGSAKPPQHLRTTAGTPTPEWFSSYSELMHPNGVKIDFFVSHFWGHDYTDTMQSLALWASAKRTDVDKSESRLVTFWICLFAINQHAAAAEVGSTPEEGPFNAALQHAHAAVMIVDEDLMPFSRIWCLFEVDRLSASKKPFQLISSEGPLEKLVEDSFRKIAGTEEQSHAIEYVAHIGKKLGKISAFHAQASSDEDRLAIWHRIGDPIVNNLPAETVRGWIEDDDGLIADVDFSQFDSRIGGLLARPLFEMHLQMNDVRGTLQYLGLGAPFAETHLQKLQKLGCEPLAVKVRMRTAGDDWREGTKLLHAAAWFGHLYAVQSLLKLKASVDATDDLEWTPLHFAAKGGNIDVIQKLVQARADVQARDNTGDSPLHFAAMNGRTEAVKHLLKNASSCNIAGENGWKPIHMAAYGGFDMIIDLLVKNRADVAAKEDTAWTALHYAAQNGVTKALSLLLKLKADVNPAGTKGQIPLHLASGNGHLEAIRLLCGAKCNINHKDSRDEVALHAAARREKPQAIKLLVDSGAKVNFVNATFQTALHCISATAVTGKKRVGIDALKVEAARVLLEAKASLEAEDINLRRPLHLAAEAGASKLVEYLVSRKASVNAASKRGWTPLHVAASSKGFAYDEEEDEDDDEEHAGGEDEEDDEEEDDDEEEQEDEADEENNSDGNEEEEGKEHPNEATRCEVVRALLRARINIEATSKRGATALHVAVDEKQSSVVKMLLDGKANVNAKRSDGATPLQLAHNNELKTLLKSRGAK